MPPRSPRYCSAFPTKFETALPCTSEGTRTMYRSPPARSSRLSPLTASRSAVSKNSSVTPLATYSPNSGSGSSSRSCSDLASISCENAAAQFPNRFRVSLGRVAVRAGLAPPLCVAPGCTCNAAQHMSCLFPCDRSRHVAGSYPAEHTGFMKRLHRWSSGVWSREVAGGGGAVDARYGFDQGSCVVPRLVRECCDLIEEERFTVGVVRVPGDAQLVQQLQKQYQEKRASASASFSILRTENASVHDAVSLLKSFLQLQGTAFPIIMQPAIVSAAQESDNDVQQQCISRLLKQLPPGNYAVLKRVFGTLALIAENSEKNMMTSEKLGTCLAPTLLPPQGVSFDQMQDMLVHGAQATQALIDGYHALFGENEKEAISAGDATELHKAMGTVALQIVSSQLHEKLSAESTSAATAPPTSITPSPSPPTLPPVLLRARSAGAISRSNSSSQSPSHSPPPSPATQDEESREELQAIAILGASLVDTVLQSEDPIAAALTNNAVDTFVETLPPPPRYTHHHVQASLYTRSSSRNGRRSKSPSLSPLRQPESPTNGPQTSPGSAPPPLPPSLQQHPESAFVPPESAALPPTMTLTSFANATATSPPITIRQVHTTYSPFSTTPPCAPPVPLPAPGALQHSPPTHSHVPHSRANLSASADQVRIRRRTWNADNCEGLQHRLSMEEEKEAATVSTTEATAMGTTTGAGTCPTLAEEEECATAVKWKNKSLAQFARVLHKEASKLHSKH
eukprot:TRINITY_DN330_c0_g1_i14.p1 TRINITY_DN330_c0_g1~~TRINITY_DN330_c0_g1_i14.p1  ORF type:complete len:739 (+),score=141.10 TRINITY_DN330_c0_g1_i14:4083-6299(+)